MNSIGIAIAAIMLLLLAAFQAPRIFAANRGKALRNIAIWLAIFAGLGTIYNVFGPGSKHPLFNKAPAAPTLTHEKPAPEPIDDRFIKNH